MMDSKSRSRLPVYRWHHGANLHWLVLCDHASNRVPAEFADLGLSAFELSRHIAWDIGTADVARRLARHLRAPLIEHCVSRLVIDANRASDDPTLIPAISDGIVIPGNRELSAADRQQRLQRYYHPYHRRIDRHLKQLAATSLAPIVVSIHSFTPRLGTVDEPRPWPIGVLWKHDRLLGQHMIRELGRDGTLVGDNEPYDARTGVGGGGTLDQHAVQRGLAHTLIELRQDQLSTPALRERWARRLFHALLRAVAQLRAHARTSNP